MKKLIVFVGIMVAAALVFMYCAESEWVENHPLDEKGSNYLVFCNSVPEADRELCREMMLSDRGNGIIGLYDTVWHKELEENPRFADWFCDNSDVTVSLTPNGITLPFCTGNVCSIVSNETDRYRTLIGPLSVTPSPRASLTVGRVSDATPADTHWYAHANVSPPPAGHYNIIYKGERGGGNCPVMTGMNQRRLTVTQAIEWDTLNPAVITLAGASSISLIVGEPNWTEPVPPTFAVDFDGTTRVPIDSIVLRRNGSRLQAFTAVASVSVPTHTLGTYTLTYHATSSYGVQAVPVERTITVSPDQPSVNPHVTIVLNNYRHVVNGVTIEHPDTAFVIGLGSYVEKGIHSISYIHPISGETVTLPPPYSFVTSGNTPGTITVVVGNPRNNPGVRNVTYTVHGGGTTGFQTTSITRRIIEHYGAIDCEVATAPSIEEQGSSILNSGAEWNFWTSWRTTRRDDAVSLTDSRLLIDLGNLDPENRWVAQNRVTSGGTGSVSNDRPGISMRLPTVTSPTQYTIRYVAIGGCGGITTQTRTITVNP